MPRTALTETTVATGVVQLRRGRTVVGWRTFVRVRGPQCPQGRLESKRWPPETTLTDLKAWREDQRVAARLAPSPVAVIPEEGFAADAAVYLKAVAAMSSIADRTRDVDAWTAVFGTRPRSAITTADISTQLAVWTKTLAASTVNHRRTALMHLWHVLDGKAAANPVKATPKLREPDALPRGVPYPVIRRVLDLMPAHQSRARLKVIAWTGLPHAQVGRLTPADVDLAQKRLVVPGRRKGSGTSARAVPLAAEAVEALREFVQVNAFGAFDHSSLWKAFDRARKKALKKYPEDRPYLVGLRPYDLRHSFGTALYAATGDIRATQLLMGHSRVEMTHRYTLAATDPRLAAAVVAFDQQGGNQGGNFSAAKTAGQGRKRTRSSAVAKPPKRAKTA